MRKQKLYQFNKLREFLEKRGYRVDRSKPIELDFGTAINEGKISFESGTGRMIYQEPSGRESYVYAYMKNYYVQRYKTLPKAHVKNCKIIKEFQENGIFNQHYIVTEKEKVDVYNLDTGETLKDQNLKICSYCKEMVTIGDRVEDTIESWYKKYGNVLEEDSNVDLNGYDAHFDKLSRAIRKEKNYTCEQCGINLSSHKHLCDVHHIDRNKRNNAQSNLMVLCAECHSKQEYHQENFSKLLNKDRVKKVKELRNR